MFFVNKQIFLKYKRKKRKERKEEIPSNSSWLGSGVVCLLENSDKFENPLRSDNPKWRMINGFGLGNFY